MPPAQRERLDYVDSIRALAAIAVVYFHGALAFGPITSGWDKAVLDFSIYAIDLGKAGVIAFFMVSGFIIPLSLKAGKPKLIALRDFMISRFFRLYPIYWVSVFACPPILQGTPLSVYDKHRLLLNLTMFQAYFGVKNVMGLYWTLQIEWMFYITCVVLFIFASLGKARRVLGTYFVFLALSFVVALLRYRTHKELPVAAFLGLSVMLMSTLWRMVVIDKQVQVKRHFRVAITSFAISIPVISLLAYQNLEGGHSWIRYTFTYWLAIGFFLFATTYGKMSWQPLAAVGRASYSLYLGNDFFRMIVDRPAVRRILLPRSANLIVLLEIVVSIACSLVFYKYVEEPMIALGRKLIRRLNGPKVTAVEKVATEFV